MVYIGYAYFEFKARSLGNVDTYGFPHISRKIGVKMRRYRVFRGSIDPKSTLPAKRKISCA